MSARPSVYALTRRRLAARVLFVVLLSAFQVPLWSQSVTTPTAPIVPASGSGFSTLASFTLPPTFYVGDKVELRIRLKLEPRRKLQVPAEMPHDQWIHIQSISITQAKDYSVVHVYFASFAPGTRSFPDINLGAVTLRGIRVTTSSLLAGGRTRLSDPKGQLLLPGSTLILGIAVALVIGLPLLFILLFRRARIKVAEMIENNRARKPWRQLKRALDALAQERSPRNARRFYITLIDAVRRYLTLKFGSDFHTVTAREFIGVSQRSMVGQEAAEALAEVLRFGELVKFAGTQASEETLDGDLNRVRHAIGVIEERVEAHEGAE